MNNHELQDTNTKDKEFDMLLNEVLDTLANPQPTETLQHKVMQRLRLAQIEDVQLESAPSLAFSRPRVLLFANRLAPRRDLSSMGIALGLHAAAILLIAFLVGSQLRSVKPAAQLITIADLPPVPSHLHAMDAPGGGGQPGVAPVSRGAPPKFSLQQSVPPKAPPLDQPRIAVEPTIEVQKELKMTTTLPNIGIENAPNVGFSSGNGRGSGVGSGDGNGMGSGSGGNTGGGVKEVGGGVSAPIRIYSVDAEFSEEARKAKLSGNVLVNFWVDRTGHVTHVSVLKGLGMGLDEKAVEAVKQFRFKPAMENGKPVTVEMNIDVNFQIF